MCLRIVVHFILTVVERPTNRGLLQLGLQVQNSAINHILTCNRLPMRILVKDQRHDMEAHETRYET